MDSFTDSNQSAITRAWATLRIGGPDLDPDLATRVLQIQPTAEPLRRPGLRPTTDARRRLSFWRLSTKDILTSVQLEDHLKWILTCLAGARGRLDSLVPGATQTDVFCYLRGPGGGGPTISASTLNRLGELGLSLGLDIYLQSI